MPCKRTALPEGLGCVSIPSKNTVLYVESVVGILSQERCGVAHFWARDISRTVKAEGRHGNIRVTFWDRDTDEDRLVREMFILTGKRTIEIAENWILHGILPEE